MKSGTKYIYTVYIYILYDLCAKMSPLNLYTQFVFFFLPQILYLFFVFFVVVVVQACFSSSETGCALGTDTKRRTVGFADENRL